MTIRLLDHEDALPELILTPETDTESELLSMLNGLTAEAHRSDVYFFRAPQEPYHASALILTFGDGSEEL